MTFKEAIELLEIDDLNNLTEESLKKKYRDVSKKNHPDHNDGNLDSEELMKQINEAYKFMKKHLQGVNYYDYVNEKTTNLNSKYLNNSSGIFDKIPAVAKIKDALSILEVFLNAPYTIDDYDNQYAVTKKVIEKIVADYREELLQDLKNSKTLLSPEADTILARATQGIQTNDNVFALTNLYRQAKKDIERIPVTQDYISAKIDYLRKKYINANVRSNDPYFKETQDYINALFAYLEKKYGNQKGNIIKFEVDYKQVEDKIAIAVTNYYNKLFDSLEDKRLFAKYPVAESIHHRAKLENYGEDRLAKIHQIYYQTKNKMENAIMDSLFESLQSVVEENKPRKNYAEVQNQINEVYISTINSIDKETVMYTNLNFKQVLQKRINQVFDNYKMLVARKEELLTDLREFGVTPAAIEILHQLENAYKYEELESTIINASARIAKLKKNAKTQQVLAVKNLLMNKFSHLSVENTNQYMNLMEEAMLLLEQTLNNQIYLNLDLLKQISFSNPIKDMELLKAACQRKVKDDSPIIEFEAYRGKNNNHSQKSGHSNQLEENFLRLIAATANQNVTTSPRGRH